MKVNGRRVLVTGGCGYIGSHVTRSLSEMGYNVIVFDNLSSGSPEALLHGETLIRGDLANKSLILKTLREYEIESVLHFAASVSVAESVHRPLQFYENNTSNTVNLLQACVEASIKNFVFSSTAAVYGETANEVVSEDTPTAPVSPYGRSKLMDEWIITDAAAAHGFRFAILRYFNVAGADQNQLLGQRSPDATHLIKVACNAALNSHGGMTIFGKDYPTKDGTCIRDYIHVEDLADVHLLSLQHLEGGGGNMLLNCGYERGYSVAEVVEAVRKVSGIDFPVRFGPRREGDIPSLIAKSNRLRETLGWKPKYDELSFIVKTALDWEKHLLRSIQPNLEQRL